VAARYCLPTSSGLVTSLWSREFPPPSCAGWGTLQGSTRRPESSPPPNVDPANSRGSTDDGKRIALDASGVAVSGGRVGSLSAPGERDADEQPPGVPVGEPDPGLGHGDGRHVDGAGPHQGIRRLTARVTPA